MSYLNASNSIYVSESRQQDIFDYYAKKNGFYRRTRKDSFLFLHKINKSDLAREVYTTKVYLYNMNSHNLIQDTIARLQRVSRFPHQRESLNSILKKFVNGLISISETINELDLFKSTYNYQ